MFGLLLNFLTEVLLFKWTLIMVYKEIHLIIFWFFASIFLVLCLLSVSYFITITHKDEEKLTAYECGFDPFESSRKNIDIHFYVVGILFLLFDMEMAYFFPFVYVLDVLPIYNLFYFFIFFWVILLGFIYEWQKGTLHWLK